MKLEIGNSSCKLSDITRDQFSELKNKLSYEVEIVTKYGRTIGRKYLLDKRGGFPTGLLYIVEKWIADNKFQVEIKDTRILPNLNPLHKKTLFKKPIGYNPYPEQLEAAKAAVYHKRGIICAPTGVGKSLIISLICEELKVPTLVVVPSLSLKTQVTKGLIEIFGEELVGPLEKGQRKFFITVENVDALNPEKALKQIDCVIVDEFHHCLMGGSKIYTDKGVKSIRQIVDSIEEFKVLSYNNQSNSFEFKKVTNKFKYKAPETLIELNYEIEGRTKKLVCTPNHKIFTTNRGYVEAKDLTLEDDVIIETGYVCPVCNKNHNSSSGVGGCVTGHKEKDPEKVAIAVAKMLNSPNRNSEAHRKASSERMKKNNPTKNKETLEKMRQSMKRYFANLSPEEQAKQLKRFKEAPKHCKNKGPTKFEQKIIDLNIPNLAYTGNGRMWLTSNGKHMNPDFKYRGHKKIVEVGDTDYWHNEEDIKQRIKNLADIGYECLYLTSDHIFGLTRVELKEMIEDFLHG